MFSYIVLAFFASSPVLTAIHPEQLNFCSKNEFWCSDGACVSLDLRCDGARDCADGSDENLCASSSNQLNLQELVLHRDRRQSRCYEHQWRCLDGSCIPFEGKCDGVVDCPDGSDETHALCRHMRATKCVLPEYPDNGTYSIVGRAGARPGLILYAVSLSVSCDPPYRPDGPAEVHCYNGQWYSPVPQCTSFCKLTPHPSVTYSCKPTDPNILSGDRKCNEYEPSGTEVHPRCNDHYHHNGVLSYMYCIDGTWDHVATCEPVCGTLTPKGELLVINGVSAKRGELPWHAGIYDKRYTPFMQICGGSLASTTVIISVAHCFWNDVERVVLPAKYFAVGVGKIFRPWNDEEGGQKSDVADIKVPPRFLGAGNNFQDDIALVILVTPIVLAYYVRPVCIDFNVLFDERQLQHGNVGKVAGWGLTSEDGKASQVLKVTELPYVDVEQCIADLPFDFRSYITSDKICAGSKTGSALCQGDSGGGLVFPEVERSIQRWYLRGLVSTAPSNGHMCNANTYTSFTQLLKHDNFVRKHLNIRACVLPSYPEHGTYSIVREGGKPGLVLDAVSLSVSCDPPYRPDGPAEVHCLNGQWYSPVPQCKRFCKLTPHPSVRYSCKLTDLNILSGDRKCNDYEPSGTEVHPRCNDHYHHNGVLSYMYCIDGTWDHVATCEPDDDKSCLTVDNVAGECVPYYLCDANDTITNDDVGIIDIRVEDGECKSYLDTCCLRSGRKAPDNPITPPPPPKSREGCGWRNPDGVGFRITGAADGEANYGEFPWMVAILKIEPVIENEPNGRKINVYIGGGSLIHPSVVLTAAHYVSSVSQLRIRAGEWDSQTTNELYPHQDRDLKEVVTHEDFNKDNLFYDIGLLFLASPVDPAPNVGVVCLPNPGVRADTGKRCIASGWGKDHFGKEGRYQFILKRAELPVVDRARCQQDLRKTRLGKYFELHSSFMCAGGEPGFDTAQGDGGSPLVCPSEYEKDRYLQHGIVAWGIGSGEQAVPGVYVDVGHLRSWIDDKVRSHGYDEKVYTYVD